MIENHPNWFRIERKLFNHPIWLGSTPPQKVVLMAVMSLARFQDTIGEWRGAEIIVKPGQLIVTNKEIIEQSGKGISRQNVRSALLRFKKFDFLTIEATKQNHFISITNWDTYQGKKKQPNHTTNQSPTITQPKPNQSPTKAQPLPNQPLLIDKERKKERKKYVYNPDSETEPATHIFSNPPEQKTKALKLTAQQHELLTGFFSELWVKFIGTTGKKACYEIFISYFLKPDFMEIYEKMLNGVDLFNKKNASRPFQMNPLKYFLDEMWEDEEAPGKEAPEENPPPVDEIRVIEMPWDQRTDFEKEAAKCRKKCPGCQGLGGPNSLTRLYKNENIKCGHCAVIEELDLKRGFTIRDVETQSQ